MHGSTAFRMEKSLIWVFSINLIHRLFLSLSIRTPAFLVGAG